MSATDGPRIGRLLVATTNAGKAAEFRELMGSVGVAVDHLGDRPAAPEVVEDGLTFRENACLKASAYARHFGAWALADDSGLSVDALDGRPGIRSARWAEQHGRGKGDADNNALVLEQTADVPDERRTARFACVLALADPEGRIVLTAADKVEGRLLRGPRGDGGFGYDPLFWIEELGRTTAELSAAEKHAVSHRGRAMRRMASLMREARLIPSSSTLGEG